MSSWTVDEEALEIDVPEAFHSTKLGAFSTQAYTNSLAAYRRYPSFWHFLEEINTAQERLLDNLFNPTPMVSAFLIQRAHSAYLGASRLTVSTQALDAYPLMRSALEYCLYAVYFKDYPELGKLWQQRHESEGARKEVRDKIKVGRMKAHLRNKDGRIQQMVDSLYESTIDFGGHPNIYGVVGGIVIDDDPTKEVIRFQNNTLVGDEPIFHLSCLHTAAVGIAVLEMMCLAFPRASIIGITDMARELQIELGHFSTALNRYLKAKQDTSPKNKDAG